MVNPKTLELQAAKEMLADIYDTQVSEVDELDSTAHVNFPSNRVGIQPIHRLESCLFRNKIHQHISRNLYKVTSPFWKQVLPHVSPGNEPLLVHSQKATSLR